MDAPPHRLHVARLGTVDYAAALALQNALVAARMRDEIGDTLLLLEHPHVYTLGRGADAGYIIDPPADVPIYRVSRGGQVTYHGPGQLIGYPIVKLAGLRRDVSRYLRNLERAMIDALRDFDIVAARRDGMTGVWAGPAQDRLDRRRHPPLGHASWLRPQRHDRSRATSTRSSPAVSRVAR